MARVDMQISRALSRLKDKGEHDFQRDEILAEMNQVQTDLCKDYYALKTTFNLTLVVGQAQYPLNAIDVITGTTYKNIWKVKESIEPSTWHHRIKWIHDFDRWAETTRDLWISGNSRYGFTWNKVINLFPIPTTADTLTILAYALPTSDLSVGADPELDSEWDEALMYGACKNLVPAFLPFYEAEAEKASQQNIKESINGVQRIDYQNDRFGILGR